jgi:hypothetical protein
MKSLTAEGALAFSKRDINEKVWRATLGPHDVLLLPAGYLVAERVGVVADTYGIKCSVLLPSDLEAYEKFDKLFISQNCPDAVLSAVIDCLTLAT